MRVLLVSQKPNAPTVTGEMVFVENLTRGLSESGIGVQSCEVGTDFLPQQDLSRLARYTRIPGIARAYGSLRGRDGFDVIHFLDSSLAPSGLGLKGAKVASSHILGNSHFRFRKGGNFASRAVESAYSRYSNAIDGFTFRRLDKIVAESDFHSSDLRSTFNLPQSKLEVIPPGVDAGLIRGSRTVDLKSRFGCEKVVAYIARLDSPAKGLAHFIEAASLMKGEDMAFVVVGDGTERGYFEKMAKERGLQGKVIFLGALDFREKTIIQKSADAVAIPSVSETFCMVFAESLAAGVPVVAFDLPFWKGLYDGAGVFTEPDSASLARGISDAIRDAALRKRLVSKGLALAEKYDVKNTVAAYLRLYDSLA
jgi:glycosyltransferase involved in cell wall biosynthesis